MAAKRTSRIGASTEVSGPSVRASIELLSRCPGDSGRQEPTPARNYGGSVQRVRTHYDNLKVSRDAPYEVIAASYEALSRVYGHRSRLGDHEAVRIMGIVDRSFSVLADPDQRREHDAWIVNEERTNLMAVAKRKIRATWRAYAPGQYWRLGLWRTVGRAFYTTRTGAVALLLLIFAVYGAYSSHYPSSKTDRGTYSRQAPSRSAARSSDANQGGDFSSLRGPAYVPGYPLLNTDGHSVVNVDNSGSDSSVLAKLVFLDGLSSRPVRTFFVPKGYRFKISGIRPGRYDIRYRALESGILSRTQSFDLAQSDTETYSGKSTEYTELTFTLYAVPRGNARVYPLADSEF